MNPEPKQSTRRRWPIWPLLIAAPIIIVGALMMGSAGSGMPDWNTPLGRAVLELRWHRILTGLIVGAGLAGAGVIMQALLRNPLAEPYVLGVSSGAGLGAALAVYLGWSVAHTWSVPAAAFITGIVTLAFVYAIGSRGGGASIYGLLLSGIVVSAVLANLLMLIVSLSSMRGMHSIMWWILGNLQLSSQSLLMVGLILVVVSLTILTLAVRS